MMVEYLVYALMISAAVSLAVSDNENERWVRFAVGAAFSATVATAIFNTVGTLSLPDADIGGTEYGEEIADRVLSEAFAEGIRTDVCERFSLAEDEVLVTARGFTYGSTLAEDVTVRLVGGACFADVVGIRNYVSKNYGECEVICGFG